MDKDADNLQYLSFYIIIRLVYHMRTTRIDRKSHTH